MVSKIISQEAEEAPVLPSMLNLLDRFNSYFEGDAEAKIVAGRLEITIGNQTLFISLPDIVGGKSRGLSSPPSDTHKHTQ